MCTEVNPRRNSYENTFSERNESPVAPNQMQRHRFHNSGEDKIKKTNEEMAHSNMLLQLGRAAILYKNNTLIKTDNVSY